jgi:hypothetical protein
LRYGFVIRYLSDIFRTYSEEDSSIQLHPGIVEFNISPEIDAGIVLITVGLDIQPEGLGYQKTGSTIGQGPRANEQPANKYFKIGSKRPSLVDLRRLHIDCDHGSRLKPLSLEVVGRFLCVVYRTYRISLAWKKCGQYRILPASGRQPQSDCCTAR